MEYKHEALIYAINDKGEEYGSDTIECTGEMIVCPTCQGKGSHFRKDLDENNLVQGMQEDYDEEGIEAYRSGSFDQICTECKGQNVVQSPNLPEWANKSISQWEQDKIHDEQVYRAECGYQW